MSMQPIWVPSDYQRELAEVAVRVISCAPIDQRDTIVQMLVQQVQDLPKFLEELKQLQHTDLNLYGAPTDVDDHLLGPALALREMKLPKVDWQMLWAAMEEEENC